MPLKTAQLQDNRRFYQNRIDFGWHFTQDLKKKLSGTLVVRLYFFQVCLFQSRAPKAYLFYPSI